MLQVVEELEIKTVILKRRRRKKYRNVEEKKIEKKKGMRRRGEVEKSEGKGKGKEGH